jgi:beta-lactamase regulating signal transducer with metallopeptidase domain
MVSGVRRPVVLLPGLAAAEHDEAALAHELAHVRRADVLTNLVQRLLEATTCFNPARAWLSRRIEREREVAADLLACSALPGRRSTYVRALVALEQRRPRAHDLKLSLDGSGDLLRRVRAVASPPFGRPQASRLLLLVAGLVWAAWLVGDFAIRPAVRGSVELVMERDLSTRIVDAFGLVGGDHRTHAAGLTPGGAARVPRPDDRCRPGC